MSRQQDRWQERMKVQKSKRSYLQDMSSPKQIIGDDKKRAQQCGDAVKLALEKYDCDLIPRMVLTSGNVQAAFLIKAKPRVANA